MRLVLCPIYEAKVTNKPNIYEMFSIYANFSNIIVLFRDKRPSIWSSVVENLWISFKVSHKAVLTVHCSWINFCYMICFELASSIKHVLKDFIGWGGGGVAVVMDVEIIF